MSRLPLRRALAVVWLALIANPAVAQTVATTRLTVTVRDAAGQPTAGADVLVAGPETAAGTTDAAGAVRFLALTPGQYTVTVSKAGSAARAEAALAVGPALSLQITLQAGAGAAAVPAASVRLGVPAGVTFGEIKALPTSRDPWAQLWLTPGLVMDRTIVGGLGPSDLSVLMSAGAPGQDTVWTLEGVPITDMSALGLSPARYDFGALQHVQVTTTGAGATRATAGADVTIVLKSGTNQPSSLQRFYMTGSALQSDNLASNLVGQVPMITRTDTTVDAGLDLGGPIGEGAAFGWVAYGYSGPRLRLLTFDEEAEAYTVLTRDVTTTHNVAANVVKPLSSGSRLTLTYFLDRTSRDGRDAGPGRAAETAVRQSGPVHVIAVNWRRVQSDRLFLDLRYGHVQATRTLEPTGGRSVVSFLDDAGVFRNTFRAETSRRPQDSVSADGEYFVAGQRLSIGAGWRRAGVETFSTWPGGQVDEHVGAPFLVAQLARDLRTAGHGTYLHAYVSDTVRLGRLTADFGVRWDRQAASVDAASVDANPVRPADLPAASVGSQSNVIVWNTIAPRLSGTLALGSGGGTVLRGSYGAFASQLGADTAALVQGLPIRSNSFYVVLDSNADNVFDPGDASAFVGTDISRSRVGDYATPRTVEVTGGIDQQLGERLTLRGSYIWRRWTGFNWLRFDGVSGSDFQLAGRLTGTAPPVGGFDEPFFVVNPLALPPDLDLVLDARDGYRQQYQGFEVSLDRGLAGGWAARVSVAGGRLLEYFESLDAQYDPTALVPTPAPFDPASPNRQAGIVMRETTGIPESGTYMAAPRFQVTGTLSGRFIFGTDIGIQYVGRQGFAAPYFSGRVFGSADATSETGKNVVFSPDVDEFRLPVLHVLDLRVSKELKFGRHPITIDVDIFNLLNSAAELARGYDLSRPDYNLVLDVCGPRVVRIGARMSF